MSDRKKSILPTGYVIDILVWTAKLDQIDNDELKTLFLMA